ncbi:HNH endonuclease signature motif containing protein [Agromyces larvae]|uniref:HNH endonuclease n=1 Tax=Agromyces larvae TaxID=2929802 RepID=A0ABY4BWY8_9MICO|nr:HNH endonuclease signature motif containing protein [Agromyces larvae]UOE43737.1 HNH endonuclease [Agromyces larvae]
MSQHHRRTKHTTHAPKVREQIAARLPLPCVECGHPVHAEQSWHVAHIVPASQGGRTTISNCGPAHSICNLKSGGRMGAAVTNRRRRAVRDSGEGIRKW